MSHLTPCNHCILGRIKRGAKEEGKTVTVKSGGFGFKVFVHLEGEEPKPWPQDGPPGDSNQVAEMMAITRKCCC